MRAAAGALLLLCAASAAAQEAAAPARWVVPEAGLDAPIPKGFRVAPGVGGREILRNADPRAVFPENINLTVTAHATRPELDEVLTIMRGQLAKARMTVLDSGRGKTAGGRPYGRLEFSRAAPSLPGGRARFRQLVWYVPDGERVRQVVCTLTAAAALWSSAKPAFDAFQAGLRLAPEATPSTPPRASAPSPRAYPTFGLQLTPPAGWSELPPEDERTVVTWVKRGLPFPRRKASVTISAEVRPIPGARAKAFVEDVAKSLQAEVSEGGKLGGADAWIVTRAAPAFQALFCSKHELVYTLSLQGPSAAADREALAQVATSWTWKPLQPPVGLQALAERPQPVLNAFTLRLPSLGRPRRQSSQSAFQWVVVDHTRRDVDLLVSHELARIPGVAKQGLATFRDRFGKVVTQRLGYPSPPTWGKGGTPFESYRSAPLRFKRGAVTLSIVYGVFFADADTAVAITITSRDPEDAADKTRYDALARELLDSVRLPRTAVAAPQPR